MTSESLDDLELELRKLPSVRSIGFSDRADVLLVQIHVVPETVEPGLALQATRIACRYSERPVAVELVRWRTLHVPVPGAPAATTAPAPVAPPEATIATAPAAPPEPQPAPVATETETATEAPAEPLVPVVEPEIETPAAEVAPATAPELAPTRERRVRLLAVLTFPDTDELEVHLTLAGKRAIGRAAASRGLLGAVEATVDAIRVFVPDLDATASWARTLESSSGEPFLVAVGLLTAGSSRHGLATGGSPIEAAGRATLHALNRIVARDAPIAL